MLCDHKKSDIQKHVEALENYLDSAAGAKDFSQHVLSHTDPTEFVPLHATLLQRLQTMSNLKVVLFLICPYSFHFSHNFNFRNIMRKNLYCLLK